MTPKEKAKYIVYAMLENVKAVDQYNLQLGSMNLYSAKQCALIAVDEIIKDLKESLKVAEDLHLHARGLIIGSLVDWQEVKQEIEKL
jgi:hypothetical protein